MESKSLPSCLVTTPPIKHSMIDFSIDYVCGATLSSERFSFCCIAEIP